MPDGILAHSLLQRQIARTPHEAWALLPFAWLDGIPRCSAMMAIGQVQHFGHRVFGHLRLSDIAPSTVATAKPGIAEWPQLEQGSGKFKALSSTYSAVSTSRMAFICWGHADKIHDQFAHIEAIGSRRTVGWGMISDIEVTPVCATSSLPEHFGLMDNQGYPLRPIPLPVWKAYFDHPAKRADAPWRSPGWKSENHTLCAVPNTSMPEWRTLDQMLGATL